MDIHKKDDRRGLWKAINDFETGSELQGNTFNLPCRIRQLGFSEGRAFVPRLQRYQGYRGADKENIAPSKAGERGSTDSPPTNTLDEWRAMV